jgi:hypothetical protein
MTTQLPTLAAAFIRSASPTDYEYVVREYARKTYKELCALEGINAYSVSVSFTFSSEGGKWTVIAGSKYPYENISTELLYPAADEISRRRGFVANSKFNSLAYEPVSTMGTPATAPDDSESPL